MIPEDFDYAKTYSEMEDEELLEIARDSRDLMDAAKAALAKEMESRGLKLEKDDAASGDGRRPLRRSHPHRRAATGACPGTHRIQRPE